MTKEHGPNLEMYSTLKQRPRGLPAFELEGAGHIRCWSQEQWLVRAQISSTGDLALLHGGMVRNPLSWPSDAIVSGCM